MIKNKTKSWLIVLIILFIGCENVSDNSDIEILSAPKNFSVSTISSTTSYNYTFSFNSVEFAEKYLIYYNIDNDKNTAEPLTSGEFPPITWSYLRTNSYDNTIYYFWVRAYDGDNYGNWSDPISVTLY